MFQSCWRKAFHIKKQLKLPWPQFKNKSMAFPSVPRLKLSMYTPKEKTWVNALQLHLHQQYPLKRIRNIQQNMIYKKGRKLSHSSLDHSCQSLSLCFPTYLAFLQIYTYPSKLGFIKINAQFPNSLLLIVLKLTLGRQIQVPEHSMLKIYFKVLLMVATNKI